MVFGKKKQQVTKEEEKILAEYRAKISDDIAKKEIEDKKLANKLIKKQQEETEDVEIGSDVIEDEETQEDTNSAPGTAKEELYEKLIELVNDYGEQIETQEIKGCLHAILEQFTIEAAVTKIKEEYGKTK